MSFLCFLSIAHYRWTQIVWLDTNTISWKGQKHIHQRLLSNEQGRLWERMASTVLGPGTVCLGPPKPHFPNRLHIVPLCGEALGAPDREQGAAVPLLCLTIPILKVFFLMPSLDPYSFSWKQLPHVQSQKALLKTLVPIFLSYRSPLSAGRPQ